MPAETGGAIRQGQTVLPATAFPGMWTPAILFLHQGPEPEAIPSRNPFPKASLAGISLSGPPFRAYFGSARYSGSTAFGVEGRGARMELYFKPEHEDLRRRVREFAEAEIAPVATRLDAESRFPWENVKKMADMGLFGVSVPKAYGGLELETISYILVIEELARVDASHSIT